MDFYSVRKKVIQISVLLVGVIVLYRFGKWQKYDRTASSEKAIEAEPIYDSNSDISSEIWEKDNRMPGIEMDFLNSMLKVTIRNSEEYEVFVNMLDDFTDYSIWELDMSGTNTTVYLDEIMACSNFEVLDIHNGGIIAIKNEDDFKAEPPKVLRLHNVFNMPKMNMSFSRSRIDVAIRNDEEYEVFINMLKYFADYSILELDMLGTSTTVYLDEIMESGNFTTLKMKNGGIIAIKNKDNLRDVPVFYDCEGKYYEYAFHNLKERYALIGEELTFLMRTAPVDENTQGTPVPESIRVVSVPNFKSLKLYFSQKKAAEQIIDQEVQKADVLILRGSSCTGIAIKYAKRYQKPYIYECVGCTWDALWNHSLLGKAIAPFSFLSTKRQIRNAPYVYYVTNQFLQKRYPTKGKSVGCSDVVIDRADEQTVQTRLERTERLTRNSKIKVGTAAAIDVRYKGQEYVIKAMQRLLNNGYDVEYYLAGGNRHNSSYLQDLARREGMEDRVHFVGSLAKDEMTAFYDSLDIYIQPSKQEGLPRSVVEAMSRGCLVLGTDIAGIPELLQKECLFKKGSAAAVATAVERLFTLDLTGICKYNFNKVKEYEYHALEERRKIFYKEFVREYESSNQ